MRISKIKLAQRRIFKKPIGVVFSHEYNLSLLARDTHKSFDPMKYKKIRDLLVVKNLLSRKRILIPRYVSYKNLELVHTPAYLKKIRDPLYVANILNLEIPDPWDAYILEYFRVMTGGTLLATKYALDNNTVAFNLGGGFHHAHADKGAGYCLLNDVAVAIEKFRNMGKFERPMIVDLDYHEGDGNLVFYKDDPDVYTFSMHASDWVNIDKENNTDIVLPDQCDGIEYLNILKKELPLAWRKFKPDIVYYIAGSDTYEKDLIGDLNLTRIEMLERNMFVFNRISDGALPGVIVAGGGYGPDSWQIYYDFLERVLVSR